MIHQLPDLDDCLTVSAARVEEFRKNGHTLVHNVLRPEELAVYKKSIAEAAHKYNKEKRKISERDTYGKAFLQVMNLWRVDERVKRFVLAKRFAGIAASLLGVANVRIYHDQALFKEPGGGPTPWHQDQYYWPLDTADTVTMWMPMIDISIDMGMLTFASGSHKQGVVFDHEISDDSETAFKKYIRENRFPVTRAAAMKAGDATWHYGHTIHQAPGNESDRMREVMTIIYMAEGARIAPPKNKWQAADLTTWLMDLPPGRLAASELNPLVL
ncbi:MAG: phytanoyl-CoA dioxygenase family protein [Puia sp.]|nr:phytanoyl-CoA dioxygenase family protein [Puia sp.]